MKFTIIEKNRSESWLKYANIFDIANNNGLQYSIEMDGSIIHKDSNIMIISDEKIEYGQALKIIQIIFEEIPNFTDTNESVYISDIQTYENEHCIESKINLFSCEEFVFVKFK